MALTKYFVILLSVYLNFDVSPTNSAAIPDDSDILNENDDTSTVNPETYSTTLTNDDDIGKIFESYENQYIKNSNWYNDAALIKLKETEMKSKHQKPIQIKTDEESTSRGLETTDPTVDDVVESIHNIIDEKVETKPNRTDRTIVVVVTTNVFNVNGSDDAGKRQHTLLSFGTPGMIQKETSTDPTITWHNKITTEFFNSNSSPITSQSGNKETSNEKVEKNLDKTENYFDTETILSEPEDEQEVETITTEKANERDGHSFDDIVNNIDIRHLPETVNTNSDYKPVIVAGRNLNEVLPNNNSNDILRIMKIIPSRTEEEINSLSKPFEIPAQEPDSSLMEAIENIIDTDVRKAFERDIPKTRHVPLDINIVEDALYAPLKDLSEYIVEEIPINGNYDLLKESYRSDDDTMKKAEVMERLDEKVLERYMDDFKNKVQASSKPFERIDYLPFKALIRSSDEELPSTDASTTSTTTVDDPTTMSTTIDATSITTPADDTETFPSTEPPIYEIEPAKNKGVFQPQIRDLSDVKIGSAGYFQGKFETPDHHEDNFQSLIKESARDEIGKGDKLPKADEVLINVERFEKDVVHKGTETSPRSKEEEVKDEEKISEYDGISKSSDLLQIEGIVDIENDKTPEIVNIEEVPKTDDKIPEIVNIEEVPKTAEITESLDKDDHLQFSTESTQQQHEVIPGSLKSMETDRRLRHTDDEEGQLGAENIINLGNFFYVPINDRIYDDPHLATVTPIPINEPRFIPQLDVEDILNRGNNTFIDDLLSYDVDATLLRNIEFINERDERFRDFRLKFAEEILWSGNRGRIENPVAYLTQDGEITILRVKKRAQRQYILDIVDDFERNTEIKYENNLLDLLEIYTNRDQDEVPYTLLTLMNRFSHLKNERSNIVSAMNSYVAKLMRKTLSDGGKKLFKLDYDEIMEISEDNKNDMEVERTFSHQNDGADQMNNVNISEEKRSTTVNPDTEDVVSEVVKADDETTEQHQIIKKPGFDDADNDDVEIKPIKVTNVVSNELLPTKSAHFEGRSFSADDEPVDPLRTLVEGVELTAELTKTVDNFQSFTDPNSTIHYAANQVVENKEDMELVKNDEELNSSEDSVWCATARYAFIAGGVLLIGLIVLLGVFSVLKFRQFKRNILFSC